MVSQYEMLYCTLGEPCWRLLADSWCSIKPMHMYHCTLENTHERNEDIHRRCLVSGKVDAQSILLSQAFYRSRTVADLLTFTELMLLKNNPSQSQ